MTEAGSGGGRAPSCRSFRETMGRPISHSVPVEPQPDSAVEDEPFERRPGVHGPLSARGTLGEKQRIGLRLPPIRQALGFGEGTGMAVVLRHGAGAMLRALAYGSRTIGTFRRLADPRVRPVLIRRLRRG